MNSLILFAQTSSPETGLFTESFVKTVGGSVGTLCAFGLIASFWLVKLALNGPNSPGARQLIYAFMALSLFSTIAFGISTFYLASHNREQVATAQTQVQTAKAQVQSAKAEAQTAKAEVAQVTSQLRSSSQELALVSDVFKKTVVQAPRETGPGGTSRVQLSAKTVDDLTRRIQAASATLAVPPKS